MGAGAMLRCDNCGFHGACHPMNAPIDLTQLAQSLSVALRNLLEERDLLNSVLLGMREGVLLLDSQLRIALLNPALCEMLDVVASSSLTGHPIAELVHDEKLLNQLQTYLTAAAATQRLEIQVIQDETQIGFARAVVRQRGPTTLLR